jgi:hypothetical protein
VDRVDVADQADSLDRRMLVFQRRDPRRQVPDGRGRVQVRFPAEVVGHRQGSRDDADALFVDTDAPDVALGRFRRRDDVVAGLDELHQLRNATRVSLPAHHRLEEVQPRPQDGRRVLLDLRRLLDDVGVDVVEDDHVRREGTDCLVETARRVQHALFVPDERVSVVDAQRLPVDRRHVVNVIREFEALLAGPGVSFLDDPHHLHAISVQGTVTRWS